MRDRECMCVENERQRMDVSYICMINIYSERYVSVCTRMHKRGEQESEREREHTPTRWKLSV